MRRLTVWSIGLSLTALVAISAWLAFSAHTNNQPPAAVGDVLFVTNRQIHETADPENRFDGRRGRRVNGLCRIGYRPIPLTRDLARSIEFFVPTDFQSIEDIEVLDDKAFEKRGSLLGTGRDPG